MTMHLRFALEGIRRERKQLEDRIQFLARQEQELERWLKEDEARSDDADRSEK